MGILPRQARDKRSFCQDRLGTNIGKALKKETPSGVSFADDAPVQVPRVIVFAAPL